MAALSVSSRRLPGITQHNVLPIASVPCGGYNRPIELPHLETFPGAACCRAFRSGRSPSAKFVAFETVQAKAACPTKPPGSPDEASRSLSDTAKSGV